jgi:hypothetical protein
MSENCSACDVWPTGVTCAGMFASSESTAQRLLPVRAYGCPLTLVEQCPSRQWHRQHRSGHVASKREGLDPVDERHQAQPKHGEAVRADQEIRVVARLVIADGS